MAVSLFWHVLCSSGWYCSVHGGQSRCNVAYPLTPFCQDQSQSWDTCSVYDHLISFWSPHITLRMNFWFKWYDAEMKLLNWEFHVSIVIDLMASVPILCGQRLLCFRNYAMAVLPSSTCGNRVMFLCRYNFGSSGCGSWSSRSCLALFGDYLYCRDMQCWRLWPMHLHCPWECLCMIATASEIVFWCIYNMQNLRLSELMMSTCLSTPYATAKTYWTAGLFISFCHICSLFGSFSCMVSDADNFMNIVAWLLMHVGGRVAECPRAPFCFSL
jgi:hypothetical protein